MLIGLIGVILPIVPGVGFIWLVALVYAIAERFATIDPLTFAALTILGAIGLSADLWMGHAGAKVGGASIWSLLAGLVLGAIGAIVGLVFLGIGALPGVIVGTVLGIVLAEWYRRRDWREAFKAAGGWLIGCTLSGGVQFLVGILMIVIFAWQVWRG
jgi:hypothetical protein